MTRGDRSLLDESAPLQRPYAGDKLSAWTPYAVRALYRS
jgi:hypothetical protein